MAVPFQLFKIQVTTKSLKEISNALGNWQSLPNDPNPNLLGVSSVVILSYYRAISPVTGLDWSYGYSFGIYEQMIALNLVGPVFSYQAFQHSTKQ